MGEGCGAEGDVKPKNVRRRGREHEMLRGKEAVRTRNRKGSGTGSRRSWCKQET